MLNERNLYKKDIVHYIYTKFWKCTLFYSRRDQIQVYLVGYSGFFLEEEPVVCILNAKRGLASLAYMIRE